MTIINNLLITYEYVAQQEVEEDGVTRIGHTINKGFCFGHADKLDEKTVTELVENLARNHNVARELVIITGLVKLDV